MDPFSRAPRSRSQVDGLALDDSKSSPVIDQVVVLTYFYGLCVISKAAHLQLNVIVDVVTVFICYYLELSV